MNAIEDNRYTQQWQAVAKKLPRPSAILAISAHWYTSGSRVTDVAMPEILYDMYGFPPELYQVKYPVSGAPELARRVGLVPTRELLRMERDLPVPGDDAATGYEIGPFMTADREQVVAVNAAAFAHHPEQGRLTVEEFDQLAAQDWFDPDGLFVAHAADGEVAGFHWTKRHGGGLGEVYVLAVAPAHEGKGLGRALLSRGLRHLAAVGDARVQLYVEAAEQRVVRLYRNAGFEIAQTDTAYRA